jgi:hypothetical protein
VTLDLDTPPPPRSIRRTIGRFAEGARAPDFLGGQNWWAPQLNPASIMFALIQPYFWRGEKTLPCSTTTRMPVILGDRHPSAFGMPVDWVWTDAGRDQTDRTGPTSGIRPMLTLQIDFARRARRRTNVLVHADQRRRVATETTRWVFFFAHARVPTGWGGW